jgi:hypothetical protein
MVDSLGDVRGSGNLLFGIFSTLVGCAMNLPAFNATAGQQNAKAMGPMVTAGAIYATAAGITNLGFAAHLGTDH